MSFLNKERWVSGLNQQFAKLSYAVKAYRGLKPRPFSQLCPRPAATLISPNTTADFLSEYFTLAPTNTPNCRFEDSSVRSLRRSLGDAAKFSVRTEEYRPHSICGGIQRVLSIIWNLTFFGQVLEVESQCWLIRSGFC